jgi:hypothetical protein
MNVACRTMKLGDPILMRARSKFSPTSSIECTIVLKTSHVGVIVSVVAAAVVAAVVDRNATNLLQRRVGVLQDLYQDVDAVMAGVG